MAEQRLHSGGPVWVWSILVWVGIGLADATQTVFVMRTEGMHHNWVQLYFAILLSWMPWALATVLILYLGPQYPPVKLRPLSTWLVHFSACTAILVAHAAWAAFLDVWLNPWAAASGPGPFPQVFLHKFYNTILASLILYTSILAISYVLDSRQRLALQNAETARLNEQLSQAQLNALRRQIEPHFLFNTLNAIAGLVREQRNDAAVTMIVKLSEFLRRVVQDSPTHEVPLQEELDFVHKYLDIQKVRFADRLQLKVDVPASLLSARLPSLILQPMVENAIKHGIAKRVHGGEIRIAAARQNGFLTVRVYNDGPELPSGCEANSGTGLSNIRTRLRSLYGDPSGLKLENQPPHGVEVTVSVPFKES